MPTPLEAAFWETIQRPEGCAFSVTTGEDPEMVIMSLVLDRRHFANLMDTGSSVAAYTEADKQEVMDFLYKLCASDKERSFKTFYVTTAANHPGGSGYWEVLARDREECRQVAFKHLGAKWAFDYERLEDIHELDRRRHGRIA